MNLPKILVCAPTASAKNYCAKDFIENVKSFTYPNYNWYFVDNTLDFGLNKIYLNEAYGFNADYCYSKSESVIERMAISHQMCAEHALQNNYDYILHLETDVFPPTNVIEQLLLRKKSVVGALYHRDEGKFRKLMIQKLAKVSSSTIQSLNFTPEEEAGFIDGSLKQVASVGLGAVLIHKSVLDRIKFRFVNGKDMHPDSFFAEDCFMNKIGIFADTSIICEHRNKAWGVYGKDFF